MWTGWADGSILLYLNSQASGWPGSKSSGCPLPWCVFGVMWVTLQPRPECDLRGCDYVSAASGS